MPARRTPEQYAAVAAAGEPPRNDDPRFASDDDAWHEAQNEWHEKVRDAFGYDELSPPGISERRKEWQTAIKTAAAFRKKLSEDPTLAHPRDEMDDGTTRNERRAQQRREHKALERQRKTAYQRSLLVHEMQRKPFTIRTLFAFSDRTVSAMSAMIGVSPDGVICTSTTDHEAPPALHVISPAGVRQCSFSAQSLKGIRGLVCTRDAIFVSGNLDVRNTSRIVQKYDYEGTLLCDTRTVDAGYLWLVEDFIYTAGPGSRCGRFAVLRITDLQQVGGFANITPDSHKSEKERAEKLSNPHGYATHAEIKSIYGLAVHGDELFVASRPEDFRGFPLTPHINVFSRDGTFLRRLNLEAFWPTGVGPDGKSLAPWIPSSREKHKYSHEPSCLMAAQSAEHGPILVTISYNHEDCFPWTRYDHVCVHKLDGTALHRVRFASTPHDATVSGSRIYVATRKGDYPEHTLRFMSGIWKEFDYDLSAAECVIGVRIVDVEF